MATSKQKIRIYVSKLGHKSGEILMIESNLFKDDSVELNLFINPNSTEINMVEDIKNFMIHVFEKLMPYLENSNVKFNVEYFFNKEYSANGQLLYYHKKNDEESERYFHEMFWVNLKKPLTEREIELFITALRQIPSLGN